MIYSQVFKKDYGNINTYGQFVSIKSWNDQNVHKLVNLNRRIQFKIAMDLLFVAYHFNPFEWTRMTVLIYKFQVSEITPYDKPLNLVTVVTASFSQTSNTGTHDINLQ